MYEQNGVQFSAQINLCLVLVDVVPWVLVSVNCFFKERGRGKKSHQGKLSIDISIWSVCQRRNSKLDISFPIYGFFSGLSVKLYSQIATVSVVLVTFGNSLSVFWDYIDFFFPSGFHIAIWHLIDPDLQSGQYH